MKEMLKQQRLRFPNLLTFCCDFYAIACAYSLTFFLRFHSSTGEKIFETLPVLFGFQAGDPGIQLQTFYLTSASRLIVIISIVVCTLYALRNLYDGKRHLLPIPIAWNVIVSNAIALALFYSYWYLTRNVHHLRSFFASVMFFNVWFCLFFRKALQAMLRQLRQRYGFDRHNALLLGTGSRIDFIKAFLESRQPHGINVTKHLTLDDLTTEKKGSEWLQKAIDTYQPDMVICDASELPVPEIMEILKLTQDAQCPTKILSPAFNVLVNRSRLMCDSIKGTPLVHFDVAPCNGRIGYLRQGLTLASAALTLFIVSPLMLLIALVIRLTSQGPALFVQERIGVNRIPFQLYKFRTMYSEAEEQQAEVEEFNETDGTLFKMKHDPRITPFGRFLRRFSLDELPQLFNVIKGDMLIVGPRPLPRRDFNHYYEQWHYSRHSGKPGLTCLWQISGRSNVHFHDMCMMDVYYLRNHNWILDFKIIIRTMLVVLFGDGAY